MTQCRCQQGRPLVKAAARRADAPAPRPRPCADGAKPRRRRRRAPLCEHVLGRSLPPRPSKPRPCHASVSRAPTRRVEGAEGGWLRALRYRRLPFHVPPTAALILVCACDVRLRVSFHSAPHPPHTRAHPTLPLTLSRPGSLTKKEAFPPHGKRTKAAEMARGARPFACGRRGGRLITPRIGSHPHVAAVHTRHSVAWAHTA